MKKVKLTKPQRELLAEFADRPTSCADGYQPLQKLLSLGLVEGRTLRLSTIYHATEAGRSALRAEREGE